MSFFVDEPELSPSESLVPLCGACKLNRGCRSPKLGFTGRITQGGILVVSEGPDEHDDRAGLFVQKSRGMLLVKRTLVELGVSLSNVAFTGATICHAPEGTSSEHMRYCAPTLQQTIEELRPSVIVLLGNSASSFMRSYWKSSFGMPSAFRGYAIPHVELNAWVVCVPNPNDVMAFSEKNPVELVLFQQQMKQVALAFQSGVPHPNGPPDYQSQIELVLNEEQAIKRINHVTGKGGVCAWDYETNMLKPEGADSRIVSASICWEGKRTFAFLWTPAIQEAMSAFLLAENVKKIASNLKFEERWTLQKMGHGVNGWLWDTMVAAHVIDNREGVTSVKFQAFVLLGVPSWADKVDGLLSSDGPSTPNNIHKIPVKDLLEYNALDSVYEYYVAKEQMRISNLTGALRYLR